MSGRVLLFLFEAAAGLALVWIGFESAGRSAPGLREAPWFWCLIGVLLLIPARHFCWYQFSNIDGGFDGGCDD